MHAVKGLPMEKWLCLGSLGVAGLMFFLFLMNLVLGLPFGEGIGTAVDIVVIVAAGLLAYLSWNAFRDLR
jgi:hypothetical protein